MSTIVAPATVAPLASSHVDRAASPKNHHPLPPASITPVSSSSRLPSGSQDGTTAKSSPEGKLTPNSNVASKIIVKKEPPSSPTMSSQTRPRPRKLDLSASSLSVRGPAGPMTARDGLVIQEVGLACLSPGFQTHDPERQEQLQRSIAVREQQRSIIESRLQKSAKGDGGDKGSDSNPFGSLKLAKKRPPPGLSIVPPSASQFANERVVQSAPLNKTFTGRHDPPPLTRHLLNHTPSLLSPSHIHHVPATQTNNRLPPLSDVFGSDLAARERERERNVTFHSSGVNSSQSTTTGSTIPPYTSSPGHSSTSQQQRAREYRSAEEAVHELSGGREELLPRLVHYNGHQQPTTPPSPYTNGNLGAAPGSQQSHVPATSQGTARRRTRNEYEQDNGSPPLGTGPDMRFRNGPGPAVSSYGPFGAGRDSPETQRKKKEEFLSLCARAWDLFHS